MRTFLHPLIGGLLLCVTIDCHAAEVKRPDCLGIRPGMTVVEARQCLENYDDKLVVQSREVQNPSLSEKPFVDRLFVARTNNASAQSELVQAVITRPPNQPVVWKVLRSLNFESGQELTKSNLLAALNEKYGKESHTKELGDMCVFRYWVFGTNGNLIEGEASSQGVDFWQRAYSSSLALDSQPGYRERVPGATSFPHKRTHVMSTRSVREPPLP